MRTKLFRKRKPQQVAKQGPRRGEKGNVGVPGEEEGVSGGGGDGPAYCSPNSLRVKGKKP